MSSSFNHHGGDSFYESRAGGVLNSERSSATENKRAETFDGGGYGIFWDEYHSIEQSSTGDPRTTSSTGAQSIPDSEDGNSSKDGKSHFVELFTI